MIKTNEVREGNLITRSNPAPATKILTVYNVEKASQRIGIIDLLGFDGFVFCENAEGITLTPEILEMIGAVKAENSAFWEIDLKNNVGEIRINPNNGILWLTHRRKHGGACINPMTGKKYYLHQLQNLFFALSGVELDVKKILQ